jgi:hypothetical protein
VVKRVNHEKTEGKILYHMSDDQFLKDTGPWRFLAYVRSLNLQKHEITHYTLFIKEIIAKMLCNQHCRTQYGRHVRNRISNRNHSLNFMWRISFSSDDSIFITSGVQETKNEFSYIFFVSSVH